MNLSVVGLGKLGLCFALTLEKAGYGVVGVDVDPTYVKSINDKSLKSFEPGVERTLKGAVNLTATTYLRQAVEWSDYLFVMVATPSLPNGYYDHSQVDGVVAQLETFGRQPQQKHFVVCCTTMPGYCDSIKERLAAINYTVSYNPEFIAQGSILRDQENPDMVLIGEANQSVGDAIEEIYRRHTRSLPTFARMTPKEAELTKISLNCFITTKIAYANMIGDIAIASGARPEVVLKAVGADSRVGNKYLRFGYGYGGPCFGRDNRALAIYASQVHRPAHVAVATDQSNQQHGRIQIDDYANTHPDRTVPVVLNSVTYKPGTVILTESQQLLFAERLADAGYPVVVQETKPVVEELREKYRGTKYETTITLVVRE